MFLQIVEQGKHEIQLLLNAVELACANKWEEAHNIVQKFDTAPAAWIHAVLHRLEGDLVNAQYWYQRAGRAMSHSSPFDELILIKKSLGRE